MKRSWKLMLVALPVLALLSILVSNSVLAQTFLNEPSIMGVSYYELAEWQAMYGRSSLFGSGGPGCGYPVHDLELCPAPPACTYQVRRPTKRKGRK